MTRLTPLAAAAALLLPGPLLAQIQTPPLPLPRDSPHAMVTQTLGVTEIEVDYHRPAVRGREIWGGLVPYDQVWRAGANDTTTLRTSDPVLIEGQPLPAGTYGLHALPGQDSWQIIFNADANSWGSYFHRPERDVLRVTVTPVAGPFQEWMEYRFEDLSRDAAVLVLAWDELAVPVRIEVDTDAVVLDSIRNDYLRNLAGFTADGYLRAATWCLNAETNQEEALAWVQQALRRETSFTGLWVQARLLTALGRDEEASQAVQRSLALGTEAEVNQLGYAFLAAGDTDEAIGVFQANVERHPESWNVYDSLAEAYDKAGRTEEAIEGYAKALELATDATQRARIEQILGRLQG